MIFLYSCGYDITNNYDLVLINKSPKEISLLYSNEISAQTQNNVAYYLSGQSATPPDSSRIIYKTGGKDAWRNYIKEGKAKRLYLYIFETDTLKKYQNMYSMSYLVSQRKFRKILDYSVNELEQNHWKIVAR